MSEEGGGHSGAAVGTAAAPTSGSAAHAGAANDQPGVAPGFKTRVTMEMPEDDEFPHSPHGTQTPNPFSRRQTSIDLDDYFVSSLQLSRQEMASRNQNGPQQSADRLYY